MEELEKELKDLKAEQYDMQSAFDKYKREMEAKIAGLSERIAEVKGEKKEEVAVNDEVNNESQEKTTEVPVESNTEPQTDAIQTQEIATTPMAEGVPLIQPEIEKVPEGISLQPAVDLPPLTPVGIDLAGSNENTTSGTVEERRTVVKTDLEKPRAILLNTVNTDERLSQASAARKSRTVQEGLVYKEEKTEAVGPVIAMPTEQVVASPVVKIPVGEQPVIAPVQNAPVDSIESIDAQMKAMIDELTVTTDETRANEINKNIAALNEKKMLLTRPVAQ